jgi:dTDP-4-amino-4,6-dideoxygalactose transaminase
LTLLPAKCAEGTRRTSHKFLLSVKGSVSIVVMQKASREMELRPATYPVTEAIHREMLSLPMGPHLSEEDTASVIEAVESFEA